MKRLNELDCLRGLAIMGVLGIHIMVHCKGYLPNDAVASSYFYAFICLCGRIGVPSFLILSGFFLTRDELSGKEIGKAVSRRIRRILPPYLFWSCVYFLWTYPGLFSWEAGRNPGVIFLEKLLTGTVSWHLYFIFLLVQYYVFCSVGLAGRGKVRLGELIAAGGVQILFVVMCYLAAYHGYFFEDAPAMERVLYFFKAYRLSFFPMYIGYFIFGRWLGANYAYVVGTCRKYRLLFFVCMLAGAVGAVGETALVGFFSGDPVGLPADWMIGTNIFVVFALAFLLPFLSKLRDDGATSRWLTRTATVSFIVYLLHEPLMGVCTIFMYNVLGGMYLWELFVPVASVTVTSAIALVFYFSVARIVPHKLSKIMFG